MEGGIKLKRRAFLFFALSFCFSQRLFSGTNIAFLEGMSSVPYAFMFKNSEENSRVYAGILEEGSDGGENEVFQENRFSFFRFSSPSDAVFSLSSGETDALILPVNVASKLYSFSRGEILCAASTQEMDFYCVTSVSSCKNLSDLLGKRVSFSKGGLGESFIKWILGENSLPVGTGRGGISIEWTENEPLSLSRLLGNNVSFAFLSEPCVSNAVKNPKYHIAVDFQDEFDAVKGRPSRLVKNVLLVRRQFFEENFSDFDALLASLEKSIGEVMKNPSKASVLCVKNGIVPGVSLLPNAICRSNYSFERAFEAKDAILESLEIYSGMRGEKLEVPGDDFFIP